MIYKLLTKQEEKQLFKEYNAGSTTAFNLLINHNLTNVKTAIQQLGYSNHYLRNDLIGEGNITLITAIQKFDIDNGVRFFAYLKTAIKNDIIMYLANHSSTISLPHRKAILKHKINKYDNLEEATLELNLTPLQVNAYKDYGYDSIISINSPTNEDDNDSTIDVEDNNKPYNDDYDYISKALHILTPQEQTIIEHSFGINGKPKLTLEDIGGLFNKTKIWSFKQKHKALDKLKTYMSNNNY